MTSLVTPILQGNRFIGLVVSDIELTHLYNLLNKIRPVDYVEIFLVSNNKNFIAFTKDKKYSTKPIESYFGTFYLNKFIIPKK